VVLAGGDRCSTKADGCLWSKLPGLLLTAFICEADHGILLPVYATFERYAIGFPYA